jgi:hypothetical protein
MQKLTLSPLLIAAALGGTFERDIFTDVKDRGPEQVPDPYNPLGRKAVHFSETHITDRIKAERRLNGPSPQTLRKRALNGGKKY